MNTSDPRALSEAAGSALWAKLQLKADMFDYLCWLDGMEGPEELHGVKRLCIASDGTTCWGNTYAEAVRVAMEHDKEIFDAMQPAATVDEEIARQANAGTLNAAMRGPNTGGEPRA